MTDFDEEKEHALVEYGEFKGNPMIILRRSSTDQHPFQFSMGKARLICDNIQAIEEFVAKHKK